MKKLKLDKYTINKKDIFVFIINTVFWIIIQLTYVCICKLKSGEITDAFLLLYFCILSMMLVLAVGIYSYVKLRSLMRCFLNMFLSFSIGLNVAISACLYYANDAFDSKFNGSDLASYIDAYELIFIIAFFQLLVYVIAKLIHVIALAIRKRRPAAEKGIK